MTAFVQQAGKSVDVAYLVTVMLVGLATQGVLQFHDFVDTMEVLQIGFLIQDFLQSAYVVDGMTVFRNWTRPRFVRQSRIGALVLKSFVLIPVPENPVHCYIKDIFNFFIVGMIL